MGPGTSSPPLTILFGLVALSVILFAVGLILRRRGGLASRGALLAWAILAIAPLFGAGAVMFTKHSAGLVSGEVEPGQNYPPQAH